MLEVSQARRPRAGCGQRVGLRDHEVTRKRLAIDERLSPLAGALFAIFCRAVTVLRGQRTMLACFSAVIACALTLSGGTNDDLRAGHRAHAFVLLIRDVTLLHHEITRVGCLISRESSDVTGVGDLIALVGRVLARLRGLLALAGAAAPNLTAALVDTQVGARRPQVIIAGDLITISSQLVDVSTGLTAVSTRLISTGQRLV